MSTVKTDTVIGSFTPLPVVKSANDVEAYAATVGQTVFTTTKFNQTSAIKVYALAVDGSFAIVTASWTAINTVTISGISLTAGQTLYIYSVGVSPSDIKVTNSAGVLTDLNTLIATHLPLFAGKGRKPLTPNAGLTGSQWADEISVPKYIDKLVTAAPGASYVLDLSVATVFDLTLSVDTTLSLSNVPALSGECLNIVVRVTQPAVAKALTWFGGSTWLTLNGTAPAAPAALKTIEYHFSTANGTNWTGRRGAYN